MYIGTTQPEMEKVTTIIVIGGCGFVGVHLSNTLKNKGKVVVVVDIAPRPKQLSPDVLYICCGATNETEMRTIVSTHRPEVIIHLASTGMSGSPMLNPICRVINVEAAAVAVRICLDLNVENLIYTSTYNVVYGGKEILDGNEDNPYFPTESHCDHYAPSKRLAEECVLSANGKSMANGRKLKTCAIRPAAIYGEGEQRHFPRLIKHIDSGLFIFRIGRAVVDWVHVENLVLGFTCAIDKLVASDDSAAAAPAGRPYFISDGSPVDNFEFFRPLCQARGCDFPSLTVPTSLMLALGYFLERLYFASSAVGCAIEPFLTRAEVYKVGVSHYFSMDRARRELGYVPAFNSSVGAKRVADHYAFRSKEDNAYFFRGSHLLWYILITFGMSLTYALAYDVIDFQALAAAGTARPGLVGQAIAGSTKFLRFCDSLALTLFSSRRGIKTVFWCATATHVFEAWMAAAQATAIGCSKTVGLWFVQTLILGYPSLSILNERAAFTQQAEMRKGSNK